MSDSEVSAWIAQHHEDSLIAAIHASNYDIFLKLLEAGQDPGSYDYQFNRGLSLPVLPIHVAAANSDPRYLAALLRFKADPDDCCQYDNPDFDNAFRATVRAAKWDNLETLIQAGGVRGEVDSSYLWEERNKFLFPYEEDEEKKAVMRAFVQSLFELPWARLVQTILPDREIARRRACLSRYDSLGPMEENNDPTQELNNLDWILTIDLPHLDPTRRLNIVERLISHGADVACFRASSYTDMWDLRAKSLAENTPKCAPHASPLESLSNSFHAAHTPVHSCVFTRDVPILQYLVREAKFDVDTPEFTTRAASPLLLAIERNDITLSTTLLELGASINFVTPIMHLTAVHFAASTRNLSLLQWVLARIEEACRNRSVDILSRKSLLGHTALHVACLPREFDLSIPQSIHYVLPSFVMPTRQDDFPSRIFIELLIAVGAGNWTDQDNHGNTPAHYLASIVGGGGLNAEESSEAIGLLQGVQGLVDNLRNDSGDTVDDLTGHLGMIDDSMSIS